MTDINSTRNHHHTPTSNVAMSAPGAETPNASAPFAALTSSAEPPSSRARVSGDVQAMSRHSARGREDIEKMTKLGGRIDRNGDGVVSEVEKRLAVGRGVARALMKRLDQDRDGQLKRAETPEALISADKNADGSVTRQELRRAFNGGISREERFEGFDSDGDGVLSGRELADPRFSRGRDHDGDGQVTRDEFLAGRARPAVPPSPPVVAVPPVVPRRSTPATGPGASTGAVAAVERARMPSADDVFASARLDRSAPVKVSWYHPHRQNETPTLRISGNVTSENFFREVALASMNVGMSPRRMTSVLQDALPAALKGLGVKLDAEGQARLERTIRQRTAGLPRANPIPNHLHPDLTGKYLDHNPAAAGWRDSAWARSLTDRLPRT